MDMQTLSSAIQEMDRLRTYKILKQILGANNPWSQSKINYVELMRFIGGLLLIR